MFTSYVYLLRVLFIWLYFGFVLFYIACILILVLLLIAEFGFSCCLSFFDCV